MIAGQSRSSENIFKINNIIFNFSVNDIQSPSKDLGLLQRVLDTMITDESYFSSLTKYKNEELQKVLQSLGMTYPEINHQLLGAYFKGLAKRRVFPRIRRNTMGESRELSSLE